MSLHAGQVIGSYTVTELHKTGSFGSVYAGTDGQGRKVALKFIPTGGAEAATELTVVKFVQDHPHPALIGILAVEAVRGGHAVVMEWADATLQDRLDESARGAEPMSAPEALAQVRRIATGLDYLAANGFAHHDVKPANVMLVGGTAKLADFGFAHSAAASLASMAFRGTPQFVPPEVCTGKSAGNRSDQYSLAVMYHWLRRNESPYRELRDHELSPAALIQVHLSGKPSLEGLTSGERAAVARALSKDPRKRFHNCTAFVEQLAITYRPEAARRRFRYAMAAMLFVGLIGLGWLGTLVVSPRPADPLPPTREEFDRMVSEVARKVDLQDRNALRSLLMAEAPAEWKEADKALFVEGMIDGGTLFTPTFKDFDELKKESALLKERVNELERKATALRGKQFSAAVADFENVPAGVRPPMLDCTKPEGASAETVKAAQQAWAGFLGKKAETDVEISKTRSARMVLLPPGRFWYGSGGKAKLVEIKYPIWIGKYELPENIYHEVTTGLHKHDPELLPIHGVSFHDAINFCEKAGKIVIGLRLPDEIEWEYAYRAGTRSKYYNGDDDAKVSEIAHFNNRAAVKPEPGDSNRLPNAFGLHHMAGNMWEWCLGDEFKVELVNQTLRCKPIRGGGFHSPTPDECCATVAGQYDKTSTDGRLGFRVCIPIDLDEITK